MRNSISRPQYLNRAKEFKTNRIIFQDKYNKPKEPMKGTMVIPTFVYCPVMGLIHSYKEVEIIVQ